MIPWRIVTIATDGTSGGVTDFTTAATLWTRPHTHNNKENLMSDMFCFQCEQTAGGKGCTRTGRLRQES
jgi:hypothetical protein